MSGDEKPKKFVYFNIDDVEDMKRKRLQSLSKRIGFKANKSSDYLKEKLKEYYEKYEKEIVALGKEQKKQRAESKRKREEKEKKAKEDKKKRKKKKKKKST
eukprot:TRINITY_DN16487_c0_g1_i1.p1 TRINITY_DN16487_c0_g1~~TRINITY_DN16487_c0_g1_i1.p1  ORF type:complete len:101 (-),score=43.53 TRINITY_DN16487_c0_g1_i1:77-379(-)